MTNNQSLGVAIAVVLALAAAAFLYYQGTFSRGIVYPGGDRVANSYVAGSLAFEYPPNYYVYERDVGTPTHPQQAIVLVEDTEENRAVVEGRSDTPREGPTAITIDVYPNPQGLSPEAWVENDTNWTIRSSELAPATVGGKAGVSYTWSGLYEGRSTVLTDGVHAYVLSVTWMTPEDEILRTYDELLASLRIGS